MSRLGRGRGLRLASAFAVLAIASNVVAAPFTYNAPGKLEQKEVYGYYGNGNTDAKVQAPGMRFPIEKAPAYANSQIFGLGGNGWNGNKPKSSPQGWKDPKNYAYPWWDNYCEIRGWDMPMCPTGEGHQGQDIRPADPANDTHWVVAVVDGTITNAYEATADYLVELVGADGTAYQYLHMSSVVVKDGQKVKKGDHIGKVSNKFYSGGASVPTSTHLHWQMKRNGIFIPVYTSLLASYGDLLGEPVGGVKYAAKFASQSWPYSSAPAIELTEGESQDGFIELENIGTETWKSGVVKLAPTPRDKASAFAAPSWASPTRVSTVDKDVPPGGKFKFPLALAGNVVGGPTTQTFNLLAEGAAWFSDAPPNGGGPPDDQIEVKIVVKAAPPGSGGKGGAAGSAGGAGSKAGGAGGGTGGASGKGGSAGQTGAAGKSGSSPGSGGGGTSGKGGTSASGGSKGEGSSGNAGTSATAGAGGSPTTGKGGGAGRKNDDDGPSSAPTPEAEGESCGCRSAGVDPASSWTASLGLGIIALFAARRRRQSTLRSAFSRRTIVDLLQPD